MKAFILTDESARADLIAAIEQIPIDPVRPYTLKLVPFGEPPTTKQKSYYRGVVLTTLCDHTGYTPREMHRTLVAQFELEAGYAVCDNGPELFEARASKAVMSQFIDIVIRWAAIELDCAIPPPR